ncbi:PREDICTED: protein YLS9-like [Nelumbo nucifera]|uniref:Protein YLS9-like n=2 Tax=Nelumbo nucifera TaxID=4432 RepID=A0A822XUW3_NELNU|nr:PREDICTED: protein YLS9-like [Nelumbo nucifera]DAD22971.1 TPA_asm: hypothetical protein HUJ06_024434 [Nelumbo nucifera]
MNNNTDTNSGQPQRPSKYVMLSENGGEATGIRPPPYRRNIPRYHKSSHKSGFIFYLYTFFQPKIPSYKFERIDVNNFDMQKDFSLYAEFVVTVKAENPNDKIGIVYDKDSIVLVDYDDSTLCSGKLPAFHQGYKNITVLNIVLKGKSEFGSGLQAALMDNRKTNRIPLFIRVKAPVNVVLGNVPLRQFDVFLNCSMVVDNLSPNKTVSILSTKYNVSVAL